MQIKKYIKFIVITIIISLIIMFINKYTFLDNFFLVHLAILLSLGLRYLSINGYYDSISYGAYRLFTKDTNKVDFADYKEEKHSKKNVSLKSYAIISTIFVIATFLFQIFFY